MSVYILTSVKIFATSSPLNFFGVNWGVSYFYPFFLLKLLYRIYLFVYIFLAARRIQMLIISDVESAPWNYHST